MKKINKLLLVLLISLCTFIINVNADTKNEVTLNFEEGTIHDGYVDYDKIGNIQLLKNGTLVGNISNNMKIDLNEANYEFSITEYPLEDTGSVVSPGKVRITINGWRYAIQNGSFNLNKDKFKGTLKIKLERTHTVVNTKVENVYERITSEGTIDLSKGDYVIDFSKNDSLTNGLKTFADLTKTLYYKVVNDGLLVTDNKDEAIIKITGNENKNIAVISVVNAKNIKSANYSGLHTKYTGSKLTYEGQIDNIINETRTDYYTMCTYNFTFKYANENENQNENQNENENKIKKEYKFIKGANQKYVINKDKNLTFEINASYDLFKGGKVYIDGKLVDSKNYTSKSGSTILTFKKSYLDNLSVGSHTLKVVFNDKNTATTKFSISYKNKEVKNPKTSDNIMTYLILEIISVVSIGGYIVYRKKLN